MNGYAYDPIQGPPTPALERWRRLPSFRKEAIMRAVEEGELTQREICREFQCSLALVSMARKVLFGCIHTETK